jgi:formylglycine-generating enzyme required for sulfatase activity
MQDDEGDQTHYQNRETRVVIANLSNAPIALFRAGRTLDDTLRLMPFDGRERWFGPGNYFLRWEDRGRQLFAPIPLAGFKCGPDEDGSFVVTIRPAPKESPPRLFSDLPEFVNIPSGNFLLGDRLNPREPHYVWLTGFFVAPFEVTNAEFREFLRDSTGYEDAAHWTAEGRRWKLANESRVTAWLRPGDEDYKRFGEDDQPVSWVNWLEANAYCAWLTKKIGGGRWLFQLPTDAEWEKAARGPDNFDYGLGMTISDDEVSLYNWKKNPWEKQTVVGMKNSRLTYRSNRYGLYHMCGNVVEWTQSVNRPYNRQQPYEDDDRNHDDTPGLRVARGGSWYSASIAYLYIPYRDAFQPEHSTQDIGFRIVATVLP